MQEGKPLLLVDNLVKTYPAEDGGFLAGLLGSNRRVPALNGLSFSLAEGEVLGIIGESGSGKSALARIITGREKPDQGTVTFMQRNLTTMGEADIKAIRRHLQFISENVFSDLVDRPENKVERLVLDTTKNYAVEGGRAAALDMLEKVGLSEIYLERYTSQMSGGEKQRLAIARALLVRPKLIVADEPVANLDLNTRTQILNLMKRVGRENKTAFVFISHNPSMVRYLATAGRIATMFAGRIMEIVPGQALFDRASHPYTKTLLQVNPTPSPLPAAAVDVATARHEIERVDENQLPLDTLEGEMSAEGSMAAAAQIAANRPGCPFYRWCPEHLPRCQTETPRLLTVVRGRHSETGEYYKLPESEILPEQKAACLVYSQQWYEKPAENS